MSTKNTIRITASTLGAYTGLIGMQHDYFGTLQGSFSPSGMMIKAIGPPCQTENVWHACFPTLTLIPNYFVTGILAITISLIVFIWAVGFVQRKIGGLILIFLAALMVTVGGGFVPAFIGILAIVAGTRINAPLSWLKSHSIQFKNFLAKL